MTAERTEARLDQSPRAQLSSAVSLLHQGRVVSFPTETVYGLGADAANPAAVRRIFALKGRPADHPLIVHLAAVEQLKEWAREIPAVAWQLADRFWPGPLTLILKKAAWVPPEITGGQDTIGLRIPAHSLALDLLKAFSGGLAAPSANRFGRISPTCAEHVRDEFGDSLDLVLDGGRCEVGVESTILSLINEKPLLLRPGGVSITELAEVLDSRPETPESPAAGLRVPGMLPSHYAPRTPLVIELPEKLCARANQLQAQGVRAAFMILKKTSAEIRREERIQIVEMPSQPQAYARRLYHTMRSLDRGDNDLLVVEAPPQNEAWMAINNRLLRAATPKK